MYKKKTSPMKISYKFLFKAYFCIFQYLTVFIAYIIIKKNHISKIPNPTY